MRTWIPRLACAALAAAALSACVFVDSGKKGKDTDNDVYVYDKGGPPPWAPAHGYRRKTAYRYFPDRETYYNIEKREYVWLDHGKWKRGAHCDHVSDHDHFVALDIDGDHPEHVHHHVTKVHKGHGEAHHDTSDKDGHHEKHADTTHDHEKHVDTNHDGDKHEGKKPGKSDEKAKKKKKKD